MCSYFCRLNTYCKSILPNVSHPIKNFGYVNKLWHKFCNFHENDNFPSTFASSIAIFCENATKKQTLKSQ